MLFDIVLLIIGLALGWFVIPAPQFAKDGRDWVLSKVPGLRALVKKDL